MTFPSFASWQYAAAGAICAAIPVVIHLLNRRRPRTVEWAAMQFLEEAVKHRSRILRLRDLLLLLLRASAALFFGLALARPYVAAVDDPSGAGQAVHAVVLIDNSLSMGYQTFAGTALERAKSAAAEIIERLVEGSRITVVPLCGSSRTRHIGPFDTKPSALEALSEIQLTDRSTSAQQILGAMKLAHDASTNLPLRYVLFTDRQRLNWRDAATIRLDDDVPPLPIVDLTAPEWDNTWIARLHAADGVADSATPTTIVAELRTRGPEPRGDVRVALWVGGKEVASQSIRLAAPSLTREVSFAYTFREYQPESGQTTFVPIHVSVSPDRLPEDDEHYLLLPVVSSLPVVFVDQFGADQEDASLNRLGETRALRRLLAPSIAGSTVPPLVQIRHLRMDQLDRDVLSDCRLVAIAGVAAPREKVDLLREYVLQGGQLVVAAGGDFDPVAWNSAAWRDGNGILPLPLLPDMLGAIPGSGRRAAAPFQLSYESLGRHPYFLLPGNTEDTLRELYMEPFFFQAVNVDASTATVESLRAALHDGAVPSSATSRSADPPPAATTSADRPGPQWLTWSDSSLRSPLIASSVSGSQQQPSRDLAVADFEPKILARFTSETGAPFLVARRIGQGQVLFVASGLQSNWNTLPKTNAFIMFDRILRAMVQSTLPIRNYGSPNRIDVPIPTELRESQIELQRPGHRAVESLEAGFLQSDQLGVTVDRPLTRGIYRLHSEPSPGSPGTADRPRASWQYAFSVNGDPEESNLERLEPAAFAEFAISSRWQWVSDAATLNLAAGRTGSSDWWWWLALSVLVILLAEMLVLGWAKAVGRSDA